jgi:hypothetical protein
MVARLWFVILEEFLKLIAACLTFLIARWLYGLSTPEKDIAWLLSLDVLNVPLKFYRGIEVYHQLRGIALLRTLQK